jgi:hypothetical protein
MEFVVLLPGNYAFCGKHVLIRQTEWTAVAMLNFSA